MSVIARHYETEMQSLSKSTFVIVNLTRFEKMIETGLAIGKESLVENWTMTQIWTG